MAAMAPTHTHTTRKNSCSHRMVVRSTRWDAAHIDYRNASNASNARPADNTSSAVGRGRSEVVWVAGPNVQIDPDQCAPGVRAAEAAIAPCAAVHDFFTPFQTSVPAVTVAGTFLPAGAAVQPPQAEVADFASSGRNE
jgi:hypothetical protein